MYILEIRKQAIFLSAYMNSYLTPLQKYSVMTEYGYVKFLWIIWHLTRTNLIFIVKHQLILTYALIAITTCIAAVQRIAFINGYSYEECRVHCYC